MVGSNGNCTLLFHFISLNNLDLQVYNTGVGP